MDAHRGYVPVDPAILRAVFKSAGILQPADARRKLLQQMLSRPGGARDDKKLRQVRKMVTPWLRNERVATLWLQPKSLDILELLVGRSGFQRLRNTDSSTNDDADALTQLLKTIRELVAGLALTPVRFFEERHRPKRESLATLLSQFARPAAHENLDELQATVHRYTKVGLDIVEALQPFIRAFPLDRSDDGFDVSLLCGLARLRNDMSETIDSRQFPASLSGRYFSSRNILSTIFDTVRQVAEDKTMPAGIKTQAMFEMFRYHYARVQAAGDSPFNLHRFSPEHPLEDEAKYVIEMQYALYYLDQLERMPPLPHLEAHKWVEMGSEIRAVRLRTLSYARDARLRPTRSEIESVLEKLESPENWGTRSATRLHHFLIAGKLKDARQICDELRSIARASSRAMPDILDPIYTINSHRLRGAASAGEYRQALEKLLDDPRIFLISGHQLLKDDKDVEIYRRVIETKSRRLPER
jgi:hypothetical protein